MGDQRSRTKRRLTNVYWPANWCVRGLHGEALERERSGFRLDRRRAVGERVAEKRGNARAPPVREPPMDDAAVVLQREPDLGMASAIRRNASSQCPHSVASVRRNFRRAGVLK